MTIQQLLDAVVAVEAEITTTPAGAPELAATIARIAELQRELERTRGTLGALVADASSPPTSDEKSASDLEHALSSLMSAASSKRSSS